MFFRILPLLVFFLISCNIQDKFIFTNRIQEFKGHQPHYDFTDAKADPVLLRLLSQATVQIFRESIYTAVPIEINKDILIIPDLITFKNTSSGTGFAFCIQNSKTYILTAYHVVVGESYPEIASIPAPALSLIEDILYIKITDSLLVSATFAFGDKETDIAVLSIEEPMPIYEFFCFENLLESGNKILGLGYPLGEYKHFLEGRLANPKDDNSWIRVDMHVNPGCSGGPVFVLREGKPSIIGLFSVYYNGVQGIGGVSRFYKFKDLLINHHILFKYL